MKQPFKWDDYSDQAALLQDKAYKKKMRKAQSGSILRTTLSALLILPLSLLAMPFVKRKEIQSEDFFCIGADFQRETEKTLELLEELDSSRVLLRLKLWELDKLDELENFIAKIPKKKITLKILQDRENIENLELLEKNLHTVFAQLHTKVDFFEIGSTINRSKWGFFSVDEYMAFFEIAYKLKQNHFQNIKLMGSGVIDFEFHYTAHTLFHRAKIHYDAISALLYVDRRGAPENTQLGFSLSDKIAWLSTMVWLSPKVKQELHITEVNWPISNTAPYAPTSEHECVNEESYANYMLRYYLLAFASQQVESVSWHQLIAPGYGLIDNRDGIKKRDAFHTYKYMVQTLKSAQFLRLDIKRDYYILQFFVNEQLLQIHWSLQETTLKNEDFFNVYDKKGAKITQDILNIGASPLYIFITKEVGKKINASERV
jgi:hypothetical protein